jgi:proteic killer suppression protein
MKISYLDADIEGLCKQSKLATRKLGAESAKKLQRRLSELFAASVVAGQFSVDLHGGCRLVFKPTRQPPPAKPDGSIDWAQVDEITIIETGDYHD